MEGVEFKINGPNVGMDLTTEVLDDSDRLFRVRSLRRDLLLQVRSELAPDVIIPFQPDVLVGELVFSRFLLGPVKIAGGAGFKWALDRASDYQSRTGADQLACETIAAIELVAWWLDIEGPFAMRLQRAVELGIDIALGVERLLGDSQPEEREYRETGLSDDELLPLIPLLMHEEEMPFPVDRSLFLSTARQPFDTLLTTETKDPRDRLNGFESLIGDGEVTAVWG